MSQTPDYSIPISAEAPCGRDLDGDHGYAQLMMEIEAYLPVRYAGFARNVETEANLFKNVAKFLKESRDLGLFMGLARLQILGGDIYAFERTIGQVAYLLREHWDDVYPRCPNGDPTRRINMLTALVATRAHVAIPLENVALVQTDQDVAVTWKAWMAQTPAEKAEGGQPSRLAIAFAKAKLEALRGLAECLQRLAAAAKEIESTVSVRSGGRGSTDLTKLREPVAAILKLVQEQIGLRVPPPLPSASAVAAGGVPAHAVATGPAIASWAEARLRLEAVIDYYFEFEPSSPSLVLARQALGAIGLDLIEVLSLLLPDKFGAARFAFQGGGGSLFELPIVGMAARLPKRDTSTAQAVAAAGETAPKSPSVKDRSSRGNSDRATPAAEPTRIPDRAQAVAALRAIAAFARTQDPASPISLLLDQAGRFSGRSFADVLADILPINT